MRGIQLGGLFVAVVLGACAADPVVPDPTAPPISQPESSAAVTPSAASASRAPVGGLVIDPGAPYRGDELLAAMRASTRPGGVPAEIATEAVAERVAESISTIDGAPWAAFSVGGTCGPTGCTLEVVGTRDDAEGEDIWRFHVDPVTGRTDVVDRELRATPMAVMEALDEMARSRLDLSPALFLASTRWLPPPDEPVSSDEAVFELAYRSGNEEESCSVDVVLDAGRSEVLEVVPTDC